MSDFAMDFARTGNGRGSAERARARSVPETPVIYYMLLFLRIIRANAKILLKVSVQ
jgi:hypothetical protein